MVLIERLQETQITYCVFNAYFWKEGKNVSQTAEPFLQLRDSFSFFKNRFSCNNKAAAK